MNAVFRALDDPTRRKILELLHNGDLSAGEIAEKFAMTKPSISHHLDLLKQANLVVAVRRGQYQVYSLNLSVVDETIQWMLSIGARKPRKNKLPRLQKTRQFRTV
jgi:ArsR family transcriptional regulator, arsenate/arsenite/antimonite-responsive transcriptional repressor